MPRLVSVHRALPTLLCAFALAPAASALPSRISTVTVYDDRAQVTRVAETRVQAGEGQFLLEGLPVTLDPASLRVRAEGPRGLVLGAVEVEPVRGAEAVRGEERRLLEEIAEVEHRRREVEDALSSLRLQFEMLEALARRPGGDSGVAAGEWQQWLTRMEAAAGPLLERRRSHERSAAELDRELERLRRELADLGSGQRDSVRLRVAWRSPAAGEVALALDYQVRGASWRSAYELRLDTAAGRLVLQKQAELRQNTGEDWQDVQLVLSTARPALGGRLPQLPPRYLDILDPAAPAGGVRRMPGMDSVERLAAEPAVMADREVASFAGEQFSARWEIPGTRSVRSGAASQRLPLQQSTLEAILSARAVPAAAPQAWLYAAARYDGEAPLPAGRAALFQDGEFVGEQAFAALAPGADLELAFGVDPRIEIDWRLELDQRGTEGLVRRQNRQQRRILIEVHNRHPRPIAITVLDQLPVSRDQRIRVELERGTTPPDETDVQGRPGVLAWQREFAADERREIRFGYVVTWPQDAGAIVGL